MLICACSVPGLRDLVSYSERAQVVTPIQGVDVGGDEQVLQSPFWTTPRTSPAAVEMKKVVALAASHSFIPATPELRALLEDAVADGYSLLSIADAGASKGASAAEVGVLSAYQIQLKLRETLS
ncbi:uncharacterized protein LOC112271017 [Brachypodium distachyon]|uniref:uncharacterized protein LOC112271017 n=1 Tax=Brachypodium distachyon TaxID=15368 RepID=UPI000D0D4EF0|nr:uncharacterized protein LOC112271017 [Brachypodium distachyon]|eukprot:XP_024315664.1 uncharacterized protein LOC112271017 [Brachypodium distachyon]